MHILIEPCSAESLPDWRALRAILWPECSADEHTRDTAEFLKHPQRYSQFIAYDRKAPIGFLEASLRQDYVNGTETSPVAFVEGVFVVPNRRRHGVATLLMAQAEKWAKEMGCSELASDALIDNRISQDTHKALGFEETERVVYFRKRL